MADTNDMMKEALKRRRGHGMEVHKMLGHGHELHAKGGMPGGEHGGGALGMHGVPEGDHAMAKNSEDMHDEHPDEADDLAPDVKDGGDSDVREKSLMSKEENEAGVDDDGKFGDGEDKQQAHMKMMASVLTPEGGKNSLRSKAHSHWMKTVAKSGN